MSAQSPNAAQIAYWNGPIGKVWAQEQERRDRDHEAVTRASLQLAAPRQGEHALDIGCGSGTTTLLLSDAVAPGGRALGIDISAPMLEVARRRARETRSIAEFVEADASHYAFQPESFDLVFSQSGVMFFADPVAAFGNIHRAMKPGGRLVFSCWRQASEHWASIPETAAKPFLPPTPPSDANAPGRYAFANPDRVKSVLLQAGFHAPMLEKFDARVFIGRTPEEAAAWAIDSGPLMRTLAGCDAETRGRVQGAVTARLAQELGPEGIFVKAGAWLVSARP